jgi:XisH protein
MAKDIYHEHVKEALIKDGWVITHDPYYLDINNPSPLEIDLGAERLISAEKGSEKIVVEVKSFLNRSLTYDFYGAYGQFRIYRRGILKTDPERILFLAIAQDVYNDIQQRSFYMELIEDEKIYLLIFNPLTKIIESWIK